MSQIGSLSVGSRIDSTNDGQHESLLYHVLLPRYLPQEKPKNFHGIELQLLTQMVDNVVDLSEFIPSKTVGLLKSLKKIQFDCNAEVVAAEVNALRPGDTFAMFVRRQNCGFMIYALPEERIDAEHPTDVIVATFPGNLHPNEVYNHASDIEVTVFNKISLEGAKMTDFTNLIHSSATRCKR